MTHSLAVQMIKPLANVLFSSDLWEAALEKYASATQVTVKLFDTDLRVVGGPIHPTPLFEIFDRGGYDPGLFNQCARQCLAQTTDRSAVTVFKVHGLAVVGTSLMLDGRIVGAAVAGYVLVDFSQVSEIERIAKDARIDFARLWRVAREQSPVSQHRLTVNGELLQVLGDALLRENSRTRHSEDDALKLQQIVRARDQALCELGQTAAALRESEERLERELAAAQQLQSASALLIKDGSSQKLYQKIVDAAVAIMGSDMASMQMLFPERGSGGELQLLAFHGFDSDAAKFWKWVRADSACSCGAALKSGARVVVTNVEKCDFMEGTEDQAAYLRAGIHAVQSTPLLSRTGSLLGMISTHWSNRHTPTEHELRQFDILARQAADLLERERVEIAVRESEERFRLLANTIPQLAWMADPTGSVFWYNQGWYNYTGTTPEEMEGWGWQSVHDAQVLPKVLESWRESLATGKSFEMVFPLRGANGVFRSFLTRVEPMLNADRKVVRWFGTNTDITEQLNAERVLEEANSVLELRVKERTVELEARNAEILAQSDQLQDLSLRLMRTQDEERRRISRELHDSLGQYLASAKMGIEALKRSDASPKESRNLQQAVDTLDKCLTETRTISHLLYPPLLDEVGFSSAAKWYIEGFSERSGIHANANIDDAPTRLPVALELALFRILQESLVNVHRHAHSKSVDIQLEFSADNVTLEIRDHGQGMPSELIERFKSKDKLAGGVGLRSMSGRIRELGGSFEIQSDNDGTMIRVTAPIPVLPAKSDGDV